MTAALLGSLLPARRRQIHPVMAGLAPGMTDLSDMIT
jgi:hypothetical protein